MTIIGLISDTHGLLREEALTALNGVDAILHAGDIGQAHVLHRLDALAPTVAVRGNMDRESWSAGLPRIRTVEIGGVRIGLVHQREHWVQTGWTAEDESPRQGDEPEGMVAEEQARFVPTAATAAKSSGPVRVVVFGHSHRPLIEEAGGVIFINPGSAGPRRFDLPISIGRLHIAPDKTLHAEIVEIEVRAE